MLERDWLMRQIQSLVQVVATRILQLKQEKKHEEALQVLEELYGRLNLPKSSLLLNLSDADLLRMISVNGMPNLEKMISTAILLKEEAELFESLGREEEEAFRRSEKSLFLFLRAEELDALPPSCDYREAVGDLFGRLRGYEIPQHLLAPLAAHFERHGLYGSAEDMWFELAERGAPCLDEGQRFFSRLLDKTDEELSAGGLPRGEVLEGLDDWKRTARP